MLYKLRTPIANNSWIACQLCGRNSRWDRSSTCTLKKQNCHFNTVALSSQLQKMINYKIYGIIKNSYDEHLTLTIETNCHFVTALFYLSQLLNIMKWQSQILCATKITKQLCQNDSFVFTVGMQLRHLRMRISFKCDVLYHFIVTWKGELCFWRVQHGE